ncbi:MarR family winged helix-turn-helix transcriptional regulator [Bacillus sp. S/N-304-OC-R1]|uniref:MarR family winged helix-turn-helix transcriptional regulator n=1 Tax=Bacillus sp. S/N-304-OC-R1 TaxID=2758034 RepID=UPI001C8D67B3|nr:MarR family winged helix-turn-helix transcriptional regulator [Bacillus sp. S/N-304-OC-R1]MBY0123188.1 winged helix-turn-helix transcriptional regulator [Bacillus sp. S/N-304-OC-R1]
MLENYIQEIKGFNRFYTRAIGLFNIYTDESSYSATEALILFEISNQEDCTAAYLSNFFLLDKGYISRILKHFEREELIVKRASEEDRRIQYIDLTELGINTLNSLALKASSTVEKMIDGISEEKIQELIKSMQKIETILHKKIK